MDPIQLLVYVIVIIILIVVVFWLLHHLGGMFIVPLGIEHEVMYHDNGGAITQSLL
jgi:hypothetical protein